MDLKAPKQLQINQGAKLAKDITLILSTGKRVDISLYIHNLTYTDRKHKGVFLEVHKDDTFTAFNHVMRNIVCSILSELNLIDININVNLDTIIGNDPYVLILLYERCKDYTHLNFNVEKYPIEKDHTYNAFYTNLTEFLYCTALSVLSGRGASDFGDIQRLYNIISYNASKQVYRIIVEQDISKPMYKKVYKKFIKKIKCVLNISKPG